MSELLPCPFCGGTEAVPVHDYARVLHSYFECDSCGCEGPGAGAQEEAARLWNTRTFTAQQTRAPYKVENVSSENASTVESTDARRTDDESASMPDAQQKPP